MHELKGRALQTEVTAWLEIRETEGTLSCSFVSSVTMGRSMVAAEVTDTPDAKTEATGRGTGHRQSPWKKGFGVKSPSVTGVRAWMLFSE